MKNVLKTQLGKLCQLCQQRDQNSYGNASQKKKQGPILANGSPTAYIRSSPVQNNCKAQ